MGVEAQNQESKRESYSIVLEISVENCGVTKFHDTSAVCSVILPFARVLHNTSRGIGHCTLALRHALATVESKSKLR